MKNGTFTTVTIDEDFEVTFGQAHRTGASAHVSAIAMSDIHGILAIATGPIVRIYRFERGTRESPFPFTSRFLLLIRYRVRQLTFLTCVSVTSVAT